MSTLRTDLVSIGAGIAGMIAAIRAAQGGRKVLVLEKLTDETYVCNSRLTQGVWHCALADVLSDPAELESRIMETTRHEARPDLARAVAHDGARVVRWMQEVGVRFMKGPLDYQSFVLAPPSVTNDGGHQWKGRGGDVMLRTLEAELNRLGGRILRGHLATRLIKSGDKVTGVEGETAEGARFSIAADAVVIADGGFQTNEALTQQHVFPKPGDVFQRNARTGMGSGLTMAQEAGAGVTDLGSFYGHVLSRDAFTNEKLSPYPFLDFVLGAGMVVDKRGERFADEGRGGIVMANLIASSDDPLDKIVIADARIWRDAGTFRLLSPNPNLPNAGGTMHQADSIASLATLCGVDPQRLEAEIDRYNASVKQGTTGALTPPRSKGAAQAIEEGPFYAIPVCAGITYTMGGISINADGQALTPTGEAIPGLYAVGCAAGGLEGGSVHGYVGGLVKSSVTGLRAAEHVLSGLVAQQAQTDALLRTPPPERPAPQSQASPPTYTTLHFLVQHGDKGAVLVSVALLVLGIVLLIGGFGPLWAIPIVVLGVAFVHLLMRSYVELVRVIVDMLLPK